MRYNDDDSILNYWIYSLPYAHRLNVLARIHDMMDVGIPEHKAMRVAVRGFKQEHPDIRPVYEQEVVGA